MDIFLANLGLIWPFTVLLVSAIGMMIYVAVRPRMLINRMLKECRKIKEANEVIEILIKAKVLCGDLETPLLSDLSINCSPKLLGEVIATWLNKSAYNDHVASRIIRLGWSEKKISKFLSGMDKYPGVRDGLEICLNSVRAEEISIADETRRNQIIASGLRAAGYRYERTNEAGGEEDDLIR